MFRYLPRFSYVSIALAAAVVLSGCGGLLTTRGLNLTGGSVPVGTSKAAIIVDTGSAFSESPAAQVTMTLNILTSRSVPGTGTPETPIPLPPPDSAILVPVNPTGTLVGKFREYLFDNLPAGRYTLTISIPNDDTFGAFEWSFDLPAATTARAVASLLPKSFDPTAVTDVAVTPRYVNASIGESVQFMGVAAADSGQLIPYPVSYMLMGDTGELAPSGLFTARRAGNSQLTAWMNGKSATAYMTIVP